VEIREEAGTAQIGEDPIGDDRHAEVPEHGEDL
jgi:hypothetical protein